MYFQIAALSLTLLFSAPRTRGRSTTPPPAPFGPVPSARQLAWHQLEFYAFVHFNMNTFTGREWGDGREDSNLFNPAQLDCRQWARICRDAGMKGIILTAKHHDGFCLWPTKYTDHSVASSTWRNGRGDVLRELADACREYGLKMGIYLSPWDRHEPSYGDSPRYNAHFKNQLREVLTNYGDIFEVWFDGANGEGPNGKKQVYDWDGYIRTVRRYQPDAVIFSDAGPDVRWVGNEKGFANESNWCTLRRDEVYPGYPNYRELTSGHPDGQYWVPAEADVSIRPGWYYHPEQDSEVKSLPALLGIYYRSVGRNAALLLNIPVDRRGLIHENDARRLLAFRKALDASFAYNLAASAGISSTNARGNDPAFRAERALDDAPATYWAADDTVTAATITVDLAEMMEINCVLLQEYIALGQRVVSFTIEAFDGSWAVATRGTTIGYKRILTFPTRTASKLRLTIDARACPTLSTLAIFRVPDRNLRLVTE